MTCETINNFETGLPNTAFVCVPVKDRNPNMALQAMNEAFYLQLFSFTVQNYMNRYLPHLFSTWNNTSPLDLCMALKGRSNTLCLGMLFKKQHHTVLAPSFLTVFHFLFLWFIATCLSLYIYWLTISFTRIRM